jgi:L-threonylcarbamoyladenylate synthase
MAFSSERYVTIRLDVHPDVHTPERYAQRIAQAAEILRAGGLVAFPTETVYGLGADATNATAVEGIFTAKGRPHSDPLIVHIPDVGSLPLVAHDIPAMAYTLAQRFWPGPLTLVLPRAEHIPSTVAAGGDTVGVRAPSHPVAQALLRAAGVPVAAPSANRFMGVSPTTAAHVLADLDGRIDAILDGGPTSLGVESTVLDLTTRPPRILRPGGLTLEALQEVISDILGPSLSPGAAEAVDAPDGQRLRAPGQLARHYAPTTQLIVFDADGARGAAAVLQAAREAVARGEHVGALVTDDELPALEAAGVLVAPLGQPDDLAQVAQRLYAALRMLDDRTLDVIYAHTFGQARMGLALWDRLRRAAGGVLQTVGDNTTAQ